MRSRAAADSWLESGAARVILGTLAYKEPETLSGLLEERGPEKDSRGLGLRGWQGGDERLDHGQGVGVLEAARRFEAAGVVNLLATAVGRDGMATGPDLETLRVLCAFGKKLKVLASGGHQEPPRPRRDRAEGGGGSCHRAGALRRRRRPGRGEGGAAGGELR